MFAVNEREIMNASVVCVSRLVIGHGTSHLALQNVILWFTLCRRCMKFGAFLLLVCPLSHGTISKVTHTPLQGVSLRNCSEPSLQNG
jgi:hypothetical protein